MYIDYCLNEPPKQAASRFRSYGTPLEHTALLISYYDIHVSSHSSCAVFQVPPNILRAPVSIAVQSPKFSMTESIDVDLVYKKRMNNT